MAPRCHRVSAVAVLVTLLVSIAVGHRAAAESDPVGQTNDPTDVIDGTDVSDLAPFAITGDTPVADVAIDRWPDVPGQSIGDVPHLAEPTETIEQVGGFEAPINVGNDYAVRLRTLLTPEVSGTYRFWISGDDDMRLFMNGSGDAPSGAEQVAFIAGWTTFRQWNRFWSQRSAWVELEAGTAYYMEAIGKEGSGDDHFSVAWELAAGFEREVVPARVLEATQLGSGGWRRSTPTGLPGMPAEMTDPQWTTLVGPSDAVVGWGAVDGAEWYEITLEGSGESRHLVTDDPAVVFDNLVPDTRYLIEVTPASAAGRQPGAGRVFVTEPGPYPTPVAPVPGSEPTVTYDHWNTGWWTLTSVPEGVAPESTTTLATGLEVPPMRGDNHASRMRAVITPTRTDTYTFHLSGDDDARLLFNPDGAWAHGAEPVAYVSGWTEQYQWNRYRSQTTPAYELVAGRSYYIEAIGVHGLGLDHLEVGWSTPGSPIEVVPSDVLAPTMSGAGGWRQDSAGLRVAPGPVRNVTSTVSAGSTGGASVGVTWDAPLVTDDFGAATSYVVTVVDGDTVVVDTVVLDTAGGASATVTGLEPGVPSVIAVSAVNDIGTGPAVDHVLVGQTTSSTTNPTSTTTPTTSTTSTTTSTTISPTAGCSEATGNGNGNGYGLDRGAPGNAYGLSGDCDDQPSDDEDVGVCDPHITGNGNGVGHTQHGNGQGNGHDGDCLGALVDSGDAPVYVPPPVIAAANKAAKGVGRGLQG
jgi:PA14 domain